MHFFVCFFDKKIKLNFRGHISTFTLAQTMVPLHLTTDH